MLKLTTTETIKSREVFRWSGQTEVEPVDVPPAPSISVQLTSSRLNGDDCVFITPFEVVEVEPKTNEITIIEPIDTATASAQVLTCPRCNGEMIKRIAKTGARQGQRFFGCRQFPKCRGVVNIS